MTNLNQNKPGGCLIFNINLLNFLCIFVAVSWIFCIKLFGIFFLTEYNFFCITSQEVNEQHFDTRRAHVWFAWIENKLLYRNKKGENSYIYFPISGYFLHIVKSHFRSIHNTHRVSVFAYKSCVLCEEIRILKVFRYFIFFLFSGTNDIYRNQWRLIKS